MKHRVAVLILAVVASVGLPSSPVAARTECSAEYVDSYDVRAKPRRNIYRMGQTALIDVIVEDSVTGTRVSDVDAGLVVLGRGKRSPYGLGTTDTEGRLTLRLPLRPSSIRPGWAHAFVAAYEYVNTPVYCTGRYGQREYKKLFRIRR